MVRALSSPTLPPGLFLLPLGAVLQVLVGLIVGFLGARLLRLTRAERHVYLVCTTFGNSAALPLLFASALFANSPSLPQLVAPLSFFLLGWTGLFWSFARYLLSTISPAPAQPIDSSLSESTKGKTLRMITTFLKNIATPPLLGSLLGLLVGMIRPARVLLTSSPLYSALSTLGTGYGPAAILILAGSLARSSPSGSQSASSKVSSNVGEEVVKLRSFRMVCGISVTRYVIMPIVAMTAVKYGPFRAPFVAFAFLLEAVMPSAQNSTIILNMQKRYSVASALASLLLIVYLVGVVPISVALTVFLASTGVS